MRGEGITTRQMQQAPRNAFYVWVNAHYDYPRRLAAHLERKDLRIVNPEHCFIGIYDPVVIDHAARVSAKTAEEIRWANERASRVW